MKSKGHRGPYLFGLGVGVALLLALGAGGWGLLGTSIAQAAEKPIAAMRALPAGAHIGTLNPRIPDSSLPCVDPPNGSVNCANLVASIEIDDRDNNPDTAGTPGVVDANYGRTAADHTAALPHDDSAHCGQNENDQDCPVNTPRAYGDWDDIDPDTADLSTVNPVKGNHKIVDSIANNDDSI